MHFGTAHSQRGLLLLSEMFGAVIVMGLVVTFLGILMFNQRMSTGKLVGEQMSAINVGVQRFLKTYAEQIRKIDPACARMRLGGDGKEPPPPTSGCALRDAAGQQIVANAYQPSVHELAKLQLVRADDTLMLPYAPVVIDGASGDTATARLAIVIRCVTPGGCAGDTPKPAVSGTDTAPITALSASGTMAYAATARNESAPLASAPTPLPDTIDVITVDPTTKERKPGTLSCGISTERSPETAFEPVFIDRNDLKVIFLKPTKEDILKAIAARESYIFNHVLYCRARLAADGTGTGNGNGNGGGTKAASWALESMVFNTQPYYFGQTTPPMGAGAQLVVAMETIGYKARLAMINGSAAASQSLQGTRGPQVLSVDNPLRSADGKGGVPGVLALVDRLDSLDMATLPSSGGDNGAATCVAGGSVSCRDGSALPTQAWDFNQQDLRRVGVLQASSAEIGGNMQARVVDVGGREHLSRPLMALRAPAAGTDTVLKVRGDVQMMQDSVIAASFIESANLAVSKGTALDGPIRIGGGGAASLFIHDQAALRLPRAVPGTRCSGMADVALSYAGHLVDKSNNDWRDAQGFRYQRFLLICGGNIHTGGLESGENIWRNTEYEALTKSKGATHRWVWAVPKDDDGYRRDMDRPSTYLN